MASGQRIARRLGHRGLSSDELASLRSLLQLLDRYLRDAWEVADGDEGDLVLARLDAQPASPPPSGRPWVGCAQRPRQFAPTRAIHRPLRAAEVLAVLNDPPVDGAAGTVRAVTPAPAQADASARCVRLDAWPLEFRSYPDDWLRILAALSGGAQSPSALAERTGATPERVAGCLAALDKAGLLSCSEPPCAPTASDPPWRRFARELGRRLRVA